MRFDELLFHVEWVRQPIVACVVNPPPPRIRGRADLLQRKLRRHEMSSACAADFELHLSAPCDTSA